MRKNKRFIAAMACVMVMGLTACGSGADNAAGGSRQIDPVPITEGVEQSGGDTEEQNVTETQGTQLLFDGRQESQEQASSESDAELEEKLAAHREARENAKPVSPGNGVTMGGSVSEEEYGISYDASILSTFDPGEMAEAFGTTDSYVAEYRDNGTWQYLILVRDGKGSAWDAG